MNASSAPDERRPNTSPSFLLRHEPDRRHFLAVAGQEDVSGQRRVVPCLATDPRVPGDLLEPIGSCSDGHQISALGQDQQQVLVGQQQQLAMAVPAALPLPASVVDVDAGKNAAIEPECMALMHDEIVEVGLQPRGFPALGNAPLAGVARDGDAAQAEAVTLRDQQASLPDRSRLDDAVATRPRVLP